MTKVEELRWEMASRLCGYYAMVFQYEDKDDAFSKALSDVDSLIAAARQEVIEMERKRIWDAGVVMMADMKTNPHKVFVADVKVFQKEVT